MELGIGPEELRTPLEEIQKNLAKFDLTPNQAKVYLYLGKIGSKTAPEVSKILKMPRTETYSLLTVLQNKGIVTATFGHPTSFEALPLEKAIEILVKNEKDKILELENEKTKLVKMWNSTPSFSIETEPNDDRFQIIKGKSPIDGKLSDMFRTAKKEMAVFGSERNFIKFYHSKSFEDLTQIKASLKMLYSGSDKAMELLKDIPKECIRRYNQKNNENMCFFIKDDAEIILFIKDMSYPTEVVALWTDSRMIVYSLRLLFNLMWAKHDSDQVDKKFSVEDFLSYDFKHRIKELEQEKVLVKVLENHITESKNKL